MSGVLCLATDESLPLSASVSWSQDGENRGKTAVTSGGSNQSSQWTLRTQEGPAEGLSSGNSFPVITALIPTEPSNKTLSYTCLLPKSRGALNLSRSPALALMHQHCCLCKKGIGVLCVLDRLVVVAANHVRRCRKWETRLLDDRSARTDRRGVRWQ